MSLYIHLLVVEPGEQPGRCREHAGGINGAANETCRKKKIVRRGKGACGASIGR